MDNGEKILATIFMILVIFLFCFIGVMCGERMGRESMRKNVVYPEIKKIKFHKTDSTKNDTIYRYVPVK